MDSMPPESCCGGELNRRAFLLLATSSLVVACQSAPTAPAPSGARKQVNAGLASQVREGEVSSAHQSQGFFLARHGGKLIAFSSYCTHRRCELEVQGDQSFHCPCHGSDFNRDGQVVHGPATRNLPVFPVTLDGNGNALVTVGA